MNTIQPTHTKDEVIDLIAQTTARSAAAGSIHIVEVGSLDDFLSVEQTTQLRELFGSRAVPIKQITNLRDDTQATTTVSPTHQIKFVPSSTLKITNEVLIYDDVVAVYRLDPTPLFWQVQDQSYADMMRQWFELLWSQAS